MAEDHLFIDVQDALKARYTVEREIGRGGAARVFLARTPSGVSVALKVLHPQLLISVTASRFLREVRLIRRLDHPNIAHLIDSGEEGGFVYYAMSYAEGPTLRDALRRVRSLTPTDTTRVARDLLDALAHAHANRVMHRDLKPENIVLAENRAVLLDFVIARALEVSTEPGITRSGVSVGTCTYMSPEQIGAEKTQDYRTDLYSLGVVLYECLTGKVPFSDKSEGAILRKHLTEDPPPLRTLRPDTPPALAGAIERAMRKQPADRWPNAMAMKRALESEAGLVQPTSIQ